MSVKQSIKVAAIIGMVGILLSRVLGFVRNALINYIFFGNASDAFYAAFKIPDVMFNLLLGGTLSTAFIPIFAGYLAKEKEEEGWKIASNFINIIMISILVLTTLGIIFAPYIVPLVAPNFKGEQLALTIKLTRIMFPAVAFTCLAALQTGILQTYHKFEIAIMGPIMYNVGIIASLLILGNRFGIEGIGYGVILSAFLNFLVQFIGLRRKNKMYSFIVDPKDEQLRTIITLAIPTIIGAAIINLNEIATQSIASFLPEGSITELGNAVSIMWLPIGIFATAITNAAYPTLTKQIALEKIDEFRFTFSKGLRTIFFITIPSAFGLAILSEPIIRLLFAFKGGEFNETHVGLTAGALSFLCIGIVFQAGIQLLMRGFYCMQDTTTPLKIGILTIFLNVIFNIIFVFYYKIGINGLALSTSLVYAINAIILWIILTKRINVIESKKVIIGFMKTFFASALMGVVLILALNTIPFDIYTKLGQIKEVAVLLVIGAGIFGILTLVLRMEEAQYFISTIKGKLKFSNSSKDI